MWKELYVRIHSIIHKILGKKYEDDFLLLARFQNVHLLDTLLFHKATEEVLTQLTP